MIDASGEGQRIVSIVTVRLQREDGKVLVELGEWEDNHVVAECKLPGKKQKHGETTAMTLDRVLATCADSIQITHAEIKETRELSRRASFKTKYMHTVNYAELTKPAASLGFQATRTRGTRPSWAPVPWQHTFTRDSVRTSAHGAGAAPDLDYFVLVDGGEGIFLYAWVESEELESLKTVVGKEALQRSLSQIYVPEDIVDVARDRHTAATEPSVQDEMCPSMAQGGCPVGAGNVIHATV